MIANLSNFSDFEIIVWDSSDIDEKEDLNTLLEKFDDLHVKLINSKIGLTIQRNNIIDYVKFKNFKYCFLDDDVEIDTNYFDVLVDKFDKDLSITVLGARIKNLPKLFKIVRNKGKLRLSGICVGI